MDSKINTTRAQQRERGRDSAQAEEGYSGSLEASKSAAFLIKTLLIIFRRTETVTHITQILLKVSKLTQLDLSRES